MTIEPARIAWVPQACTLPMADQPLRQAEFDALFATALRAFDRPDQPTSARASPRSLEDVRIELLVREQLQWLDRDPPALRLDTNYKAGVG
jgi:hypothetical protein